MSDEFDADKAVADLAAFARQLGLLRDPGDFLDEVVAELDAAIERSRVEMDRLARGAYVDEDGVEWRFVPREFSPRHCATCSCDNTAPNGTGGYL